MRLRSLLLSVAIAVACTETTAPISDGYMLVEIAGKSLPAPYAMNLNMPDRVLAANLHFDADGRGIWTWTFELQPNGAHFTSTQGMSWTKEGNKVEISFDCNDTLAAASCVGGPHLVGEVSDGRIDVTSSNIFRAPMVFITGQD
jgi:hypothetical protein